MTSAATAPTSTANGVRSAEPGRYLVFTACGDFYGLHVKRIREIIRNVDDLTRIPQMPAYVSGCLNLRGTVIPVVDLRRKFQLEPEGSSVLNCIVIGDVVVGDDILPTGLIVDEVEEVANLKATDLEPAPEFGGGLNTRFVRGMAKHKDRVVALLDLDQVIALPTLQAIKDGVEAVEPEEAVAFD